MKTIKIFSFCLTLVLALSSCSKSWLDTKMTGGSVTDDEYKDITDVNTASARGLYVLLYADQAGSGHTSFGQKSIDMATDMTASDMALVNNLYGWWGEEAALQGYKSDRSATTWYYYYIMINNANNIIRKFNPEQGLSLTAVDTVALVQAKAMRALAYYNLAYIFSPAVDDNVSTNYYAQFMNANDLVGSGTGANYPVCPIYDASEKQYNAETNLLIAQPLSSVAEVYDFVIADLEEALALFELIDYTRESTLAIDKDVVKMLLAYAYLQAGAYDVYETENGNADYFDKALILAEDVVANAPYSILPLGEVLTNGFNDVNSDNWMWGHDVTVESRTGLASFWGQIDVFTYSYAYAGSIIGMDQTLWESIADSDIRKQWFDASADGEKKNLNPYNKFFHEDRGTGSNVDREWLSDVVYMRIEEAYLIASEAAWRSGDLAKAKDYLAALVAERDTVIASQIVNYNDEEFENYLYKNWRVEMWGEGRALRTLKRFCPAMYKERGKNHYYNLGSGNQVNFNDATLIFWMPSSEYKYNSNYRQDEVQE